VLPGKKRKGALVAGADAARRGDGDAVACWIATALPALGDDAVHQGWRSRSSARRAGPRRFAARAELAERAILVVLDQVGDPHNVARCCGRGGVRAFGVIVATHGAPAATGALAKAASAAGAGAADRRDEPRRTLERLKELGLVLRPRRARARVLADIDLGPRVRVCSAPRVRGSPDGARKRDHLARLPTNGQCEP